MLDRRTLIASAVLAFAAGGAPALESPQQRLLSPGALPEKPVGDPGAPVTIIQYASVTCAFCARFHVEVWPVLREKYVETGKVRFLIREFPLDALATGAFMLARCAGDEKWYQVIDRLYRTKETWAHAADPARALFDAVEPLGFTRDSFKTCLDDDKLFEAIKTSAERAMKQFGVTSTPTFFIDGQKYVGLLSLAQFDQILEPLLAARKP